MIGEHVRGHVDVTVTFFRHDLEEKEEDKRRSACARARSHIVYIGHI